MKLTRFSLILWLAAVVFTGSLRRPGASSGPQKRPARPFADGTSYESPVSSRAAKQTRTGLLRNLAETDIPRDNPAEALGLVKELSAQPRGKALAALFREWAGTDPVTAVAKAMELANASERAVVLREIAGNWVANDRTAAVKWGGNLIGGSLRDQANTLF